MITEREQVDAKLRRGRMHRHNPAFCVAYDDCRRFPVPHVLAALKRYDRNLYFRYNHVIHMWELWRWYGLIAPAHAWLIPPEELVHRSGFIFKLCDPDTGVPMPPDWTLYQRIVHADRWAIGQYTGDQAADAMDSDTAKMERRKKAAQAEFVRDWSSDNKNQIRSLIGSQTIISVPR